MAENIHLENLCSVAEFKNMSAQERKEYIDKTFYHGAPFKILAKITDIFVSVMHINVTHFLVADSMVEFKLCRDDSLANIGSTGYGELPRDSVIRHCTESNLHEGDQVTCTLIVQENEKQIEKGHLLTFSIKSLTRVNLTELSQIYSEHNITYNPHKIYELRNDDTEELEIFVQGNLCDEIEKILTDGETAIKAQEETIEEQKKKLADLQTQHSELEKQIADLKKTFDEKYAEEMKNLEEKLSYLKTFDVPFDNETEENFSEDLAQIKKIYIDV